MKQIFLRAYDKEKRIMIQDQQQGLDEYYPNIKIGDRISTVVRVIGEYYGTLKLFTGLIDKNGKRIFDGDYLFWLSTKGIFSPDEDRDNLFPTKGLIQYNENEMRWGILLLEKFGKPMNHFFNPDIETYNNNFEIIGNIYETPNLLEPPKDSAL